MTYRPTDRRLSRCPSRRRRSPGRGGRFVLSAVTFGLALLVAATGCDPAARTPAAAGDPAGGEVTLTAADLSLGGGEVAATDPRRVPRNATFGVPIRVSGLPADASVTVGPITNAEGVALPAEGVEVFRVADVAVDLRRADYVRHTGQNPADVPDTLPRALLAWQDVTTDADAATGTLDNPAGDALLWVDLAVGPRQAAGDYTGSLTVAGVSYAIAFEVIDVNLPDERGLVMAGRADFADLKRLFRDEFETVVPRLIDRDDEAYADAVGVMDGLVELGHKHRLAVYLPELRPTVKWPAGRLPEIDWREFDRLTGPWLDGLAFADREPHPYWPLPASRNLDRYPIINRLDYWKQAANHFDQNGWLARSPIVVGGTGAPVGLDLPRRRRVDYNDQAGTLLQNHPSARVRVPLEVDQLELGVGVADGGRPLIRPEDTARLLPASPGLISDVPINNWPDNLDRPDTFLPTRGNSLIPYVGAGGSPADVRSWAWLAFVRGAVHIDWGPVLPETDAPTEVGDPNRVVWAYPGSWFGREGVVPSVQLKWLRQAQQDHELLTVAKQRGENASVRLLAKLLANPVQLQPLQTDPDEAYVLMAGTAEGSAWREARDLVIDAILLREPGREVDPQARTVNELAQLRWMVPRERPVLMARGTEWQVRKDDFTLGLTLDVSIYNPSDTTPGDNALIWQRVPPGWEVPPAPRPIPPLAVYQVKAFAMTAEVDPTMTDAGGRNQLVGLDFEQGDTGQKTPLRFALPAAAVGPLPGGLRLDGRLEDWDDADRIHAGPMVAMFDRPTVQAHELRNVETESTLWSGYTEENVYLAFELNGVSAGGSARGEAGNFVRYEANRAWGEDVAEVLVRGLWADGTVGPMVHLTVKPNGATIARSREGVADLWQPFEGAVRYAATLEGSEVDPTPPNGSGEGGRGLAGTDGATWRGEVALDWSALLVGDKTDDLGQPSRPDALLVNVGQHRSATGTTATWAGPVDVLHDPRFTGVLRLIKE